MRRSCFYMNMKFTQRHLNAIRSPLMTGYTPAIAGTIATTSMLNSMMLQSATPAAGTPGSVESVLEALGVCQSTLVSIPSSLLPQYILPTIHTVGVRKVASMTLPADSE